MSTRRRKDFSRRDFIKKAAGALGAVTIGGTLIGPRKTSASAPIKIGMINPLEGECAQWGVPIVRGGQVWADELNAKGGLLCGDGERHPIEYSPYTNVCYYPNEELKAAKKAILEDKKNYIFQTFTPACRKAIAPLCNEYKVLNTSYGAGFLSAEYPYLMGGMTGSPTSFLVGSAYVLEKHPELKRIAIMCVDNSWGLAAQWYFAAGCEPYKDRINIVYNKTYDPGLSDFSTLLGTIIQEKPDAILHQGWPAAKQATGLEIAYNLGYEGYWVSESWELAHILKRVSPEKIEGKLYASYGVDGSVPGFSERANKMYKVYCDRYGQQDWIQLSGITYSALCTWEVGFQKAKSIDSTTVMNTLYSMSVLDHPIYGKSVWGGKEIFGANHHMITPVPIYVVRGGKQTLSGVFELGPWWEKHKGAALPVLKKGEQTFV